MRSNFHSSLKALLPLRLAGAWPARADVTVGFALLFPTIVIWEQRIVTGRVKVGYQWLLEKEWQVDPSI